MSIYNAGELITRSGTPKSEYRCTRGHTFQDYTVGTGMPFEKILHVPEPRSLAALYCCECIKELLANIGLVALSTDMRKCAVHG